MRLERLKQCVTGIAAIALAGTIAAARNTTMGSRRDLTIPYPWRPFGPTQGDRSTGKTLTGPSRRPQVRRRPAP